MHPFNCHVCSSENLEDYIQTIDYLTLEKFKIKKCKNCTSIQLENIPDDLSKYYHTKYRKYNSIISKILNLYYKKRVYSWNKMFKNPGKVLEVGCGNGFMLNHFKSLKWEVLGVERNNETLDINNSNFDIKIITPDVYSVPLNEKFDLIILFQVLEHISNPNNLLEHLNKLLKEEGKIIIGVPNINSWQFKFFKNNWFHLDAPRHIINYNYNSLELLAKKNGLIIESENYISFEHDPFGWTQSFLNILSNKKNLLLKHLMHLEKINLIIIINYIFAFITMPFFLFLSIISWIFKKGSNIQVVLKKA